MLTCTNLISKEILETEKLCNNANLRRRANKTEKKHEVETSTLASTVVRVPSGINISNKMKINIKILHHYM